MFCSQVRTDEFLVVADEDVAIGKGRMRPANPVAGPILFAGGIDQFGASAPGNILMEHFGFTTENIVERARALL